MQCIITNAISLRGLFATRAFLRSFSVATSTEASPHRLPNANDIQVANLLKSHQMVDRLIPVRNEFLKNTPLSTLDLQKIDLCEYHRKISGLSDAVAYGTVKFLRFFADAFFRKRYVHRAIVLETVAAVPGMVAGMFRHLRCLRRMRDDGGWVAKLLHEAENERIHLMIWMQVTKPSLVERSLVTIVQGAFFSVYAAFYVFFPKTAHRLVGYLEEEAIISYTGFLKEIEQGRIENTPAPAIAICYYNLEPNATLLDTVLAVRADEAAHRDANHHFADRLLNCRENLSETYVKERAQEK